MTDELSVIEKKMKMASGRNMAVTNTVILFFDLLMLLVSVIIMQNGELTFAAGNRVLAILEEAPVVEEIQGQQETHLFHDSIKNNLRIARLEATDEELAEACKKASVHDFIMSLPKGYDTPVGELGDTLSGGERQRIGLARAFLHDAPFVLLDEPTSNLESLNEAVILKSLREEGKDKTLILVSQRKSTMCIADRVYSIEE